MHDILRERVWRKLQSLPQDQLYQVLDYIEFLEGKYAREQAVKADPIQRFAERLEDGMRIRSVAPRVITGTVGLLGTARRVLRTVSDAGREILEAPASPSRPPAGAGPDRVDNGPDRTTSGPDRTTNGTGQLPPGPGPGQEEEGRS